MSSRFSLEAHVIQGTGLGFPLFPAVACLPCEADGICGEPDPCSLYPAAAAHCSQHSYSPKGSLRLFSLTQCVTHGFSTLPLLCWVRQVHTEENKHRICCYSSLSVSSELPWYQHTNTTMSSGFVSERDFLLPSSLVCPHPLGSPSFHSSSAHLCARQLPSLLRWDPFRSFLSLLGSNPTRTICIC